MFFSPAEDAEDKVEHEEAADDDERDEEDPVERAADGVVGLREKILEVSFKWATVVAQR